MQATRSSDLSLAPQANMSSKSAQGVSLLESKGGKLKLNEQ